MIYKFKQIQLVYNKSEKVQMKLRFKQDKNHNWLNLLKYQSWKQKKTIDFTAKTVIIRIFKNNTLKQA